MNNITEEIVKKNVPALTPKALAVRLSIGRDKAYALMRSSGFPSIMIGDRFIVTEEALERWIHDCEGKCYDLDTGRIRHV